MKYTNKFINFISLVLTIIIFIAYYILFFNQNLFYEKIHHLIPDISIIKDNEKILNNAKKGTDENEKETVQNSIDLGEWYIEIPAIDLKAPIAEGTDLNTLNTKVGHFSDTSKDYGNIGLAAHNRGYEFNYFQNLKKLKKEDQIIYNYKEIKKIYFVDKIEIIENNNWEFLKESEDNRITLITCVENEPQYRRCVQAIEI